MAIYRLEMGLIDWIGSLVHGNGSSFVENRSVIDKNDSISGANLTNMEPKSIFSIVWLFFNSFYFSWPGINTTRSNLLNLSPVFWSNRVKIQCPSKIIRKFVNLKKKMSLQSFVHFLQFVFWTHEYSMHTWHLWQC